MKIAFIGGGKVGKSLGKYLKNHHYQLLGYLSSTKTSAKGAAGFTDSHAWNSLGELVSAADIIFITTPDHLIEAIAGEIGALRLPLKNKIFVHTSGAWGVKLLEPIRKTHPESLLCSLHPLQAFASPEKGVADLSLTVFTLEGDQEAAEKIYRMVTNCGNQCFLLEGKNKPLYHGAACVASNYLVTLLNLSMKLMEAAGIGAEEGLAAMLPLIQTTLDNVKVMGAAPALTGPIARGDRATVKQHLEAMARECPQLLPLYRTLGEETWKLAMEKPGNPGEMDQSFDQLWKGEGL